MQVKELDARMSIILIIKKILKGVYFIVLVIV